jgi:hypothetical protein
MDRDGIGMASLLVRKDQNDALAHQIYDRFRVELPAGASLSPALVLAHGSLCVREAAMVSPGCSRRLWVIWRLSQIRPMLMRCFV